MPEPVDVMGAVRETLQGEDDLVAVYLFGSYATGRAHPASDVDVAVLFRSTLDEEVRFQRVLQIGAALEAALRAPVDVVDLQRAGPALSFQVLKEGRLLIERDRDERSLFVMRALGRYYDAKPYLDYQNTQFLARLREEGLGRGYRGDRNALSEARRLSAKLARHAGRSAG